MAIASFSILRPCTGGWSKQKNFLNNFQRVNTSVLCCGLSTIDWGKGEKFFNLFPEGEHLCTLL